MDAMTSMTSERKIYKNILIFTAAGWCILAFLLAGFVSDWFRNWGLIEGFFTMVAFVISMVVITLHAYAISKVRFTDTFGNRDRLKIWCIIIFTVAASLWLIYSKNSI